MQPFYDIPPKVTISVTATCNLDCRHCYADCTRKPRPDEMTSDEWLEFFKYLVRNRFIQVYIEGGEPLFKEGFDELLAYSGRRMMTLVRSNGTLITAAVARKLKKLRVGHVFVDIMGAAATTHDGFTGVEGSFEKACAAVRYLCEVGIPTDAVIIMNRRNAKELNRYLRLVHDLGAGRAGILRLYPLGRVKHQWAELSMSMREQDKAIAGLTPPPGLGVMQSWHPNDSNCCWQAAAVDPFGNSIGCMYLREYVRFGNVREMPFLKTWTDNALYRDLRSGKVDESCGDCHATRGTHGGCRSSAFAFHGSWTAPDPFCTSLNGGVDLRVLPKRLLQEE